MTSISQWKKKGAWEYTMGQLQCKQAFAGQRKISVVLFAKEVTENSSTEHSPRGQWLLEKHPHRTTVKDTSSRPLESDDTENSVAVGIESSRPRTDNPLRIHQ